MKKFLNIALLGSLLISSALADEDLLAKVTNGALSDNSKGVKVLNLDEMKEVKGGYQVGFMNNGIDEYYAIAFITEAEAGIINDYLNNKSDKVGLCGIGIENCSNPSQARLVDFLNVTGGSFSFAPVYKVKRQVKYSGLGQPYVVFTYGTGVIDSKGQLYKFDTTTSGSHLNNNMLIKEMASKYKESMEQALGGWYAR